MRVDRIILFGAAVVAIVNFLIAVLAGSARAAEAAKKGVSADQSGARVAEEITRANLFDHESDWPYRVALSRSWKPAGHDGDFGWGEGTLGVLTRFDEVRGVKIDFGRFGVHWVPIDATDVVARANQIRTGELEKLAPNLAVALNHRLLDPTERTLREARDDLFLVPKDDYILVFADPAEASFAKVALATRRWAALPNAIVVLIALNERPDAHVYKFCYDAGFRGTFLMATYAAPNASAYLEPGAKPPVVQLRTAEGRVRFEAPWTPNLAETIERLASRSRPQGARAELSVLNR